MEARGLVVRVRPDVIGITKTFDYLVPEHLGDQVRVGTIVRIDLHGRRERAWVVELDVDPPEGVALKAIAKVTGWGPPPDLVDLASWAAWRWAGHPAHLLRTASPVRVVAGLPRSTPAGRIHHHAGALERAALAGGRRVVRIGPAGDRLAIVLAAAQRGDALVLTPSLAAGSALTKRLRSGGVRVAMMPDEWAIAAAGGCTVVGSRAAAWAPLPKVDAVVVLDAHEEVYVEESSPTWSAVEVAAERARRAGAPCALVSSCPTVELLDGAEVVAPPRPDERAGWPAVEVVDRRQDDPRTGLYSEALVAALRKGLAARPNIQALCVLNRKGRARLQACAACQELVRCTRCGAAVRQDRDAPEVLRCERCAMARPAVCASCGAQRLKVLRVGVTRAVEELAALLGVDVAEVSGDTDAGALPSAPVLVGTEAVLRRARRASVIAFLDLDQELLAPRYRASEQALALLARAGRLVGSRRANGLVVVQTRMPDHEVVQAAVHGDPTLVSDVEAPRRAELGLPPAKAMAEVSGAGSAQLIESIRAITPTSVEAGAIDDDRWLVRAADHQVLCDALATAPRPSSRVRIAVDPPRA